MFKTIRENTQKYGKTLNSYDVFKCIAVLLMTCDHIGFFFAPDNPWWRVVGRACVPIWFFFAGYSKPSQDNKLLWWMAAMMVAVDVMLVDAIFPLNILVSIIAARAVVNYMASRDHDAFMLLIFAFSSCALLPLTFKFFEYGSQVFFFALAGYYYRWNSDHWLGKITLLLGTLFFIIVQHASFGFTMPQGIAMALGVCAASYAMNCFTKEVYTSNTNVPYALNIFIRLLARNTHFYYIWHYLAFLIATKLMSPPQSWKIIWFAI